MLETGFLAKKNKKNRHNYCFLHHFCFLYFLFLLLQLKAIVEFCNVSREACSTGDFLKFFPTSSFVALILTSALICYIPLLFCAFPRPSRTPRYEETILLVCISLLHLVGYVGAVAVCQVCQDLRVCLGRRADEGEEVRHCLSFSCTILHFFSSTSLNWCLTVVT